MFYTTGKKWDKIMVKWDFVCSHEVFRYVAFCLISGAIESTLNMFFYTINNTYILKLENYCSTCKQ